MKKKLLFVLFTIGLIVNMYGQTNVTNNNTITINGNVYYFRPANIPSSPPPTVGRSDFISEGSWYGEDAARAWASISDWAIETCSTAGNPVIGRSGERVYIHQVHAYRKGSSGGDRYIDPYWSRGSMSFHNNYRYAVSIYYWVVASNTTMENGRRETRTFWFN